MAIHLHEKRHIKCAGTIYRKSVGVISLFFFFNGEKDIDNYGKFDNYLGYSKLAIFPEDVPSENIQSYFHLNRDMPLDPICEAYLKCTYSAEDNSEVERLKNIYQRVL